MTFLRRPTVLFVAAVVLVLYARVFLGVDLVDEAFYLSLPFRFFLGDRPFVDELNVAQTFTFLTYAPIRAFLAVTDGKLEGLVLFTRHLYFLFSLAVASTVFALMRERFGTRNALLAALTCLAFIPNNVVNLGYKSLGSGFFAIALLSGLEVRYGQRRWAPYVCGACHALAGFVNPGLIPVNLVMTGLLAFSPRRTWQPLAILAGLSVLGVVTFVVATPDGTWTRILEYHSLRGSNPDTLIMRAGQLANQFFLTNAVKKLALIACLVGYFVALRSHHVLTYALPALAVAPAMLGLGPSGYMTYYSAFGPFVLLGLGSHGVFSDAVRWVWIPSMAAAALSAITSDAGMCNTGIALLPAAVITSLGFAVVAGAINVRLAFVTQAAAVLLLLWFAAHPPFEAPLWQLGVRVANGPYKGIWTQERGRDCIEELRRDLASAPEGRGLLIYGTIAPFGYLMAPLRPLAPSVWNCAPGDRFCLQHVKERVAEGDSILKMTHYFCSGPSGPVIEYPANDPFNELLGERFVEATRRDSYVIYRAKPVVGRNLTNAP